jgi:hypothetical protein
VDEMLRADGGEKRQRKVFREFLSQFVIGVRSAAARAQRAEQGVSERRVRAGALAVAGRAGRAHRQPSRRPPPWCVCVRARGAQRGGARRADRLCAGAAPKPAVQGHANADDDAAHLYHALFH